MTGQRLKETVDQDVSFEAHRAIAREYHISAQRAYAYGGTSALLAPAAVLIAAWRYGQLTSPVPYVVGVMLFLVTLFFVKRLIDRHMNTLHERLDKYCESNTIEFQAFLRYFCDRDYTMLAAFMPKTR